jgi:hypothetical protein
MALLIAGFGQPGAGPRLPKRQFRYQGKINP